MAGALTVQISWDVSVEQKRYSPSWSLQERGDGIKKIQRRKSYDMTLVKKYNGQTKTEKSKGK